MTMEPTTLLLILAGLALAFGAGFWLGRRHSIRLATSMRALPIPA